MFGRIKDLFGKEPGSDKPTRASSFSEKETTTAVLLVEAATMDGEFDDQERETIIRALSQHFSLDETRTNELMAAAETIQQESSQLLYFTRAVKTHFDEKERIALVEMMWEVVYADGELHDYEDNLMRRIGGLIYVTERERGEARKRVLARLDQDQDKAS